jgi:hypothetical protein
MYPKFRISTAQEQLYCPQSMCIIPVLDIVYTNVITCNVASQLFSIFSMSKSTVNMLSMILSRDPEIQGNAANFGSHVFAVLVSLS